MQEIINNLLFKKHLLNNIPYQNVAERQRFIIFRLFTLFAALVSFSAFLKLFLTLHVVGIITYFIPGLTAVICINYFRLTKVSQLQSAYLTIVLSCCALMHIVSYTSGGIRTGGSFFLLAIVLYAYMLLGKKGGQYITGLVMFHFFYVYYLSVNTTITSFDLFSNNEQLIKEDFLTNISLSLFLIAGLSSYLQSSKNIVVERLESSKVELEKNNAILTKTNILLNKKLAELDKFASIASHDLKSPLRAIASLTDMVIEDSSNVLDEENKVRMGFIKQRAVRMDQLLNALFAYSKADLQAETAQNVNMLSIVHQIKSNNPYAQNTEVNIQNDFTFINTTPVAFAKVLAEILNNAFQFNTSEKPQIIIQARKSEGKCYISITDNGPGIDAAYHQKIFVMFQTLLSRDELESMGAGLAIAKKLVEENGGEIGIKSELGRGATFWFTWLESEKETITLIQQQLKSVG
jgi:signal transduction histidine kinase